MLTCWFQKLEPCYQNIRTWIWQYIYKLIPYCSWNPYHYNWSWLHLTVTYVVQMDLAVCITLLWQYSKWYWLKYGAIGPRSGPLWILFSWQTFPKSPVYGNASMVNYMLGATYYLLCAPLLHILDTLLAQIGEISWAAFTDLLQC